MNEESYLVKSRDWDKDWQLNYMIKNTTYFQKSNDCQVIVGWCASVNICNNLAVFESYMYKLINYGSIGYTIYICRMYVRNAFLPPQLFSVASFSS